MLQSKKTTTTANKSLKKKRKFDITNLLQLKAKTIQFNSEHLRPVLAVEHVQNLNNYGLIEEQQQQQKYFLICESCFWMASTLNYVTSNNNLKSIYKECPVCENKIDRFPIPKLI